MQVKHVGKGLRLKMGTKLYTGLHYTQHIVHVQHQVELLFSEANRRAPYERSVNSMHCSFIMYS